MREMMRRRMSYSENANGFLSVHWGIWGFGIVRISRRSIGLKESEWFRRSSFQGTLDFWEFIDSNELQSM
jgi:hypothetical protein